MSCRNISRAESDLCCAGIADFRKAAPTTLSFRKFRFAEYRSVPAEQTGFHKLRRRICACCRCVSHTLSMTRTFLQTDEAVRIQHDARAVCLQSVLRYGIVDLSCMRTSHTSGHSGQDTGCILLRGSFREVYPEKQSGRVGAVEPHDRDSGGHILAALEGSTARRLLTRELFFRYARRNEERRPELYGIAPVQGFGTMITTFPAERCSSVMTSTFPETERICSSR